VNSHDAPIIRQVQVRAVERHARRAIARRLGHPDDRALISVKRDSDRPGTAIIHVNSGGNAIACETALRDAGYRVDAGWGFPTDPTLRADYGAKIRVAPAKKGGTSGE
jgi:hypothetical protein